MKFRWVGPFALWMMGSVLVGVTHRFQAMVNTVALLPVFAAFIV